MKKTISIFFVFLVLFNALGFYGLFVGLKYKAGLDLVQRLDREQYHHDETFVLKVPMALPYHIDNNQFQRVDGQIEHQGEFYGLVKQKLEKDTLYIVVIKDTDAKKINQALSDYVKTFADKPVSHKQGAKFTSEIIKDFLPSSIGLSSASGGWQYTVSPATDSDQFFRSISLAIFSPPPQG